MTSSRRKIKQKKKSIHGPGSVPGNLSSGNQAPQKEEKSQSKSQKRFLPSALSLFLGSERNIKRQKNINLFLLWLLLSLSCWRSPDVCSFRVISHPCRHLNFHFWVGGGEILLFHKSIPIVVMYAVLFNNYKRPETLMRRRSIHYTNAGKISGPLCVCVCGTFRFCLFCGEGEMKLVCVFFLFTSC